jgi:ketopantoate reductase PanE/ApbA-like protein
MTGAAARALVLGAVFFTIAVPATAEAQQARNVVEFCASFWGAAIAPVRRVCAQAELPDASIQPRADASRAATTITSAQRRTSAHQPMVQPIGCVRVRQFVEGVALDPTFVDDGMRFVVKEIEPSRKASMAHDLERGKRLELDWLTGKVRALGRTLGISTPASNAVYIVLKLPRQ